MIKICNRCKTNYETTNPRSQCCETCLIKKCVICNKTFKTYNKQTCSQHCFHKLLSIKVKEIHVKEKNNLVATRYVNIANSQKTKLTDDLINSLEEVLSRTYVKDLELIARLATNNKHSSKLLKQYIKVYPDKWSMYKLKMFQGPLSKKVQLLNLDKFNELLFDLKHYSYNFNLIKWSLDPKTQKRLFDFYIKKNDFISKKESFPEKQVRRILEENNIDYKREVCFNSGKHRVDFLLNDKKVIEVNGDFWHANPIIYGEDENKYHHLQLKSLVRYQKKMLFLREKGYNVLEIWENDIDLHFKEVTEKIIKYARNNN